MESITKNRQSTATLRAIIERAYGSGAVPADDGFAEELGYGWFNVAYRLRLADGREVVLKVAPPADVEVLTYERDMMRNELAALALIAERTGVPVPHVDFADTSRDLVDADWFTMPFVRGENLGIVEETLPAAERDAFRAAVGACNRELNGIVGPHFGPLRGPGFDTWREAFLAMTGDVLADGQARAIDLGVDYDEVRGWIAGRADALEDVAEPRFVEWDLWPGNVIVDGGRIVAIIDHERAFYGDPLVESGFTALDLPAFGDPEPFLRGYGRGPLTGSEPDRRLLYTLYLVLVMIIETDYRGHEDPGQYDWARERLAELRARFAG